LSHEEAVRQIMSHTCNWQTTKVAEMDDSSDVEAEAATYVLPGIMREKSK